MLRRAAFLRAQQPLTKHNTVGHGAEYLSIAKDWDQGNYCKLCKEPMAVWNEHRGKRDHISLELMFNVIAEQARIWTPADVIRQRHERFNASLPIQALFGFSEIEQKQRRNRLFAIMQHLIDRGVLYAGPQQWRDARLNKVQMGHHGQLVMFWAMHPQIIHLFPRADAAQIASFSQACYCLYTLETVFDFLGMSQLVDARDTLGLGHSRAGSASPVSLGVGGKVCDKDEMHYAEKSIILRNMLGQVRWALAGEMDGTQLNHPIAQKAEELDPHLAILCEELAEGIITEILYTRTCEFVTRADTVWREMGCPVADYPFSGSVREVSKFGSSITKYAALNKRDHLPMSQTEHAVQMINACYHSGINALMGTNGAHGDVMSRSGGEAYHDTVRSMRAPIAPSGDPHLVTLKTLRAVEAEANAKKKPTSKMHRHQRQTALLSPVATRLLSQAVKV